MPLQESDTRETRSRAKRRGLLAVCLLPLAGCNAPSSGGAIGSWKYQVPWARQAVATETEVIAAAPHSPLFRNAAHRIAGETISPALASASGDDGVIRPLSSSPGVAAASSSDPSPVGDPSSPSDAVLIPDAAPLLADDLPMPIESSSAALEIVSPDTPQLIDLGSALGMAGGSAWTVQLARQRTVEAHANLTSARALWLPTLQFGIGWNRHDGRIQATEGQVINTDRSSLFVGGGATLGAPVAGGSGGPFRLFADLALADAYFEPKIARRMLYAQKAGVTVAKNQALRDAGSAYVDLVDAAGQIADARAAIAAATELFELTQTFEQAGAGAQADVDRASTEQARLKRQLQNANRLFRVRSAKLARRLRLDPRFVLHPADQIVVPIELSADLMEVDSEIATALSRRPEIVEHSHRIAGLCLAVKKAHVEPWIPSLTMATSAGNYRGGLGGGPVNEGGRSDVDLQAIWELESMGLGVAAKRSRAGSRLAQQRIELADLRDEITAEVVQSFEDVLNYREQIQTAEQALALAESSYRRNLQRVRAGEGLPIELLQAINARATGLRDRTAAVAHYNRAQIELLYATGQL